MHIHNKHNNQLVSNIYRHEATDLTMLYNSLRPNYIGAPYTEEYKFDAECIEQSLAHMKRGKAAGLDSLTSEHLAGSLSPILIDSSR